MAVNNNVPNSVDNSTWDDTLEKWHLQLVTENGYEFTGDIKAFYFDWDGNMCNVTLEYQNKNTVSLWVDEVEDYTDFDINGETVSAGAPEPELTVINQIANTTSQHTYDGQTATFTVLGTLPEYRFKQPTVNYTGTDGQTKAVQMQGEVLESGCVVTATVSDIDLTHPVTITGQYLYAIKIEVNLSNCYADPEIPEHLFEGDTLSVVLKANPNTAFDDTDEIPVFTYYDGDGHFQREPLTVSEDKQTATGQILLGDYQDVYVVAESYPIEVVGQQHGAINVYLVTLDDLAEFSAKRFFMETDPLTYKNVDLGVYVNRIHRVHTNIEDASTDVIRCGNYNTGVKCLQPKTDKITLDFGTARVPALNGDITDYESEVQVFLPFAGFVNLSHDYVGKTISLQYVINVVTGNGVAKFSCDGIVFQVEEVVPSSEIIYLSPTEQVKTVGGDNWNEMLYYGLEPYIYCKWYEGVKRGRNNDRKTAVLSDLSGFYVFDDVSPIHTPEMLAEEQEMIYRALSDGVYL